MGTRRGKFGVLKSHVYSPGIKCYTEFPGEYHLNTTVRLDGGPCVVLEDRGDYLRVLLGGRALWVDDYKFTEDKP